MFSEDALKQISRIFGIISAEEKRVEQQLLHSKTNSGIMTKTNNAGARKAKNNTRKYKSDGGWIAWTHEDATDHDRCPKCTALDDCWFLDTKMPENVITRSQRIENRPDGFLHPNCHCFAVAIEKPIAGVTAIAECARSKWEYLLDPEHGQNQGKAYLFFSLGYKKGSSEGALQFDYKKQGEVKYAKGEYEIRELKNEGQKIEIQITLDRPDGKGLANLRSFWMVYPNGKIRFLTSYSNKDI